MPGHLHGTPGRRSTTSTVMDSISAGPSLRVPRPRSAVQRWWPCRSYECVASVDLGEVAVNVQAGAPARYRLLRAVDRGSADSSMMARTRREGVLVVGLS